MSKTIVDHINREVDLHGKTQQGSIIEPFKKELAALGKKLAKQAVSPETAPYYVGALSSAIQKLLMWQTLTPLTGEADEWDDVTDQNEGVILYQNKRDARVFKDVSGMARFLDAIIFEDPNGNGFTGSGVLWMKMGKMIGSDHYIREFPFTPQTLIVHVEERNGIYQILDPEEMAKVREVYNLKM